MISQPYDLNFEFCKYEFIANKQENKMAKKYFGLNDLNKRILNFIYLLPVSKIKMSYRYAFGPQDM